MLKSVANGDLTDEVRQELLSLINLLDIYTILQKYVSTLVSLDIDNHRKNTV